MFLFEIRRYGKSTLVDTENCVQFIKVAAPLQNQKLTFNIKTNGRVRGCYLSG